MTKGMGNLSLDYDISANGYLQRAKHNIDKDNLEYLFYACLNLRCGIEARMRAYLEPHKHIPENKKNDWNLNNLSKSCLRYFKENNKIQRIDFYNDDGSLLGSVCYNPVTSELISNGGKLGNYLHDVKSASELTPEWWINLKNLVTETYALLKFCCSGDLLGPVLLNGKSASLYAELRNENNETLSRLRGMIGANINTSVSYHDVSKYDIFRIQDK